MDADVKAMSVEELQQEVMKLRTAIRTHRDQKGDENCWLDDGFYLYEALPEKVGADPQLPPKQLMMQNCVKYYECRKRGRLYKPFTEMPKHPIFSIEWLELSKFEPYFQWPIVCTNGLRESFIGYNASPLPNRLEIKPMDMRIDIDVTHWFPLPMLPNLIQIEEE